MHSSDVSEVQFVPVGMDDTVEKVRQRVAELPSFAGRVFTLHAEGVLLETGPFSATGIEDGGAVQVQTTHVDENTTLEKQFLEACKELDKEEPDTTLLVQQLSAVKRRWVASERTPTKMLQFLDDNMVTERYLCLQTNWAVITNNVEDVCWDHLSKKGKTLAAALQEAGFDVCFMEITYRADDGYGDDSDSDNYTAYGYFGGAPINAVTEPGLEVTGSCWPDEAGPPLNFRTLLPADDVMIKDIVGRNVFNKAINGDTEPALVFWPRRWRAKRIRCVRSFHLLEEACRGMFDPKDLGCADIVALQEVCAASVVAWTPSLRATMLECVSQPSMPGPAAAAFLTDHFTLATISEAEVASLERLLQRDTPAINTAFLDLVEFSSGMEQARCAADVLLRLAKKGVNTALLKRCVDGVATSRAVCGNGDETDSQKTEPITHFTIAILRLLLHLDMKAEMEKVVDQIQKNNKKYRVVPVAGAALALMDDAATVEVSASLVKIAQSRLQQKDVLVSSDASEVTVLMRFIACCVDAEEGKALLKKVASCTDSISRCAAVLNGALTALKGVPALGVAPVCFPAGMCQEWVWSCLANVIGNSSTTNCNFGRMYSKQRISVTMLVVPATLLQHLGGGAPAVQQLLDTPLFTSLTYDAIEALMGAVRYQDLLVQLGGAVLDVIYSRCIEHLHKTCPVLPKKLKTWHLDDTLSAPCCDDCREVCRFFASKYAKEITLKGRNVTREGHVSQRVLALPGQGRTFKAEVLSSKNSKVRGVLQICKVPCGQATDQEREQYAIDLHDHQHVQKLIEQLEARKRALPKEETPPSTTQHLPSSSEVTRDVLQIRKVPCGQANDQELQQYDNDADDDHHVEELIKKPEARKRALPKEETPTGTEHDPDAEEAVQDSPGEPPLKRRRVESQDVTPVTPQMNNEAKIEMALPTETTQPEKGTKRTAQQACAPVKRVKQAQITSYFAPRVAKK